MRGNAAASLTALAAAGFFAAAPAAAQSILLTHVSAGGTDSGICSSVSTACRTFAYAFAQTLNNGGPSSIDDHRL